jgi:RNA polymerase sigma factor (sigma-70 family)
MTVAPKLAVAPPVADRDDRVLLDGYAGGSQACFDEIVRRHAPLVRSVCRRILEDDSDADDATQAVFLVLVRKAAVLPRGASLAGWLYLTARTSALQMRRQAQMRRRHADALAQSPSVDATEAVDELAARELRLRLDEELARLPSAQREALMLRYVLGMSQADVARRLACPEETVHTRVTRGLARLRQRLGAGEAALLGALLAPPASLGAPSPAALAHATRLARVLRRARLAPAGAAAVAIVALTATLVLLAPPRAAPAAAQAPVVAAPAVAEADPLAGWSFDRLLGAAVTVDFDGRPVRALRVTPAFAGEFGRANHRLPEGGGGVVCTFRLRIESDYRYPRLFSFLARDAAETAAALPRFEDFQPTAYDQNLPDHRWFAVRYEVSRTPAGAWHESCQRDGAPWWESERPGPPADFSVLLMGGDLAIADFSVQVAPSQAPAPAPR